MAYIPYMLPINIVFNFNLCLKNININNIVGIIGLINVDGEKLVLKKFLNIKLDISNIGNNIINKYNIFFEFNFFNFCSLNFK